ncbi:MAG: fluoride efflux transporter CrcB [bacterium]|nr:fluoride efflux transporter CrcB [bacterium]
MKQTLWVFIGGGLGAILRYGMGGMVYRWLPPSFPFGTLLVNVMGSFWIGFIMVLALDRVYIPPQLRIFLTTGILSGFTTFSTFSYETVLMIREMEYLQALANVVLNLIFCLVATYLGMVLGKLF